MLTPKKIDVSVAAEYLVYLVENSPTVNTSR